MNTISKEEQKEKFQAWMSMDVNESANQYMKLLRRISKEVLEVTEANNYKLNSGKLIDFVLNDSTLSDKQKAYYLYKLGSVPEIALGIIRNMSDEMFDLHNEMTI